ncbi:2-hydroxyacid dehydrogenase [Sphingomonas pseudosanguinis]|uniref:Lactate dehydrogenase-like 2-hydroxyacid dehydrogenase n=1 Tax=Sphingomonas pseudosanguinis TaxID=413712 RepID=A0A7W6A877_9SPHN|nr:D-glycerate dehydrogenase [Sphingomonas pseudosanguinis]MBB3878931.1 lactate dehydrogenase-like 2-hydroxyacid dehydrogenase [Sphingomonas pseudosanguinis]MBN3536672.1 D-glycerate dehydrogenase [Sphingomonas pseudosanguinis]
MTDRPSLYVTRRLPEAVERHLRAHWDVTLNAGDQPPTPAQLAAAIARYDALLPTITDRIDAALLGRPDRRVRIIANYGAGVDHIDLDAARAAGVVVTNTPDVLTEATAEIAILLMLMASRRAGEGERELRDGRWTGWRPSHLIGQGLAGRTLGLVGFGRIGQATAAKARGLGMRIRYASRSRAAPEVEAALGAERATSLQALAAESDVLSLHLPGGEATRHLLDAALLSVMPRHAIVVNTARGSVIDEAALAEALAEGRIAGVGLDVYEHEPVVHPGLLAHPRAVLLPHLGSATIEARTAMGMRAVANLDAFFRREAPGDRVA